MADENQNQIVEENQTEGLMGGVPTEEPKTPDLIYGNNTFDATSYRVDPNPKAASFSCIGTLLSSSIIIAVIIGIIMIARTNPAVSMPMPIGGP